MGLRRKSGRAPRDQATKSLVNQGVYRIDVQDHELGFFHRHKAAFSFWSGVRYILILSVLLWWLPTVGQMIAGYVGGRRTGAPWKGVIAAVIPMAVIFGAAYAVEHGYIGLGADFFGALPASIVQSVSSRVPALTPYVDFVVQYIASFVIAMRTTLSMGSNGYMVTIVFAYIGGVMAEQARHEVAASGGRSGASVSITQPIFHHAQEDGEMIRSRRKEPVELATMKKIPASNVAAAHAAPVAKADEELSKEKVSTSSKDAEKKHTKRQVEPAKTRSEQQEVRLQHYVDQALSRYQEKHHH